MKAYPFLTQTNHKEKKTCQLFLSQAKRQKESLLH
jgi:hypothetical protein